jgi:hypothetical protein
LFHVTDWHGVLRKVFGHERNKVKGRREDYIKKSFMIYADQIKKDEMCRSRGTCGRQKASDQDFGGEVMERDYLKEVGVYGRMILKWMLKKWDGEECIGLLWLRIGMGSERLWIW